jgi:hypothetical protein
MDASARNAAAAKLFVARPASCVQVIPATEKARSSGGEVSRAIYAASVRFSSAVCNDRVCMVRTSICIVGTRIRSAAVKGRTRVRL